MVPELEMPLLPPEFDIVMMPDVLSMVPPLLKMPLPVEF